MAQEKKNSKFAVVKFIDEIEVIAICWMKSENEAYWPDHLVERSAVTSAIQHEEPPDEMLWKLYKIKKLYGKYETYLDARDKLKRIEAKKDRDSNATTSETDEETHGKLRRKIHARKRLIDEVDSQPSTSKKPKTCSKKGFSSKQSTSMLPPPPSMSQFLLRKPSKDSNSGQAQVKSSQAPLVTSLLVKGKSSDLPPSTSSKNSSLERLEKCNDVPPPASLRNHNNNGNSLGVEKTCDPHPFAPTFNFNSLQKDTTQDALTSCAIPLEKLTPVNFEGISSVEKRNVNPVASASCNNNNSPATSNFNFLSSEEAVLCDSDRECRAYLVRSMRSMKVQNALVLEKLTALLERTSLNAPSNPAQQSEILGDTSLWDFFPLSSMEAVKEIEMKLKKESGIREKLIKLFSLVGGRDIKSITTKMMERVLSNSVGVNYSWQGGKKKLKFNELRLWDVILHAVRCNKGFENAPEEAIKDVISKWLPQSKTRLEREAAKNEKKKTKKSVAEERETQYSSDDDSPPAQNSPINHSDSSESGDESQSLASSSGNEIH